MRIAITGGTGFVGRHTARLLAAEGHEVVLVSRGVDAGDLDVRGLAGVRFTAASVDDESALRSAFEGCAGVAHLAGINREFGTQTYQNVHVEGTRNVVSAAKAVGVKRLLLLSFLRARPGCGSGYHESKFAAEEVVRASGLQYAVLKAGILYGRGDHMLDHLSKALHTFPLFARVGSADAPARPTAVADVAKVIRAALVEGRLSNETVYVTGPEEMPFSEAVRRVGAALGRPPWVVTMPVAFHLLLAGVLEGIMRIPLVARAQVMMLAEGLVEAAPACAPLPEDLRPSTPFSSEEIRKGAPDPGGFGLNDLFG